MSCIEHGHAVNSSGYGGCRYMGVRVGRHVAAYLQAHGMHPAEVKGLVVRHKCDNRRCINPAHLELGTASDNMRDMVVRGRHNLQVRCGEANAASRLTDAEVDYIRKNYRRGTNHLNRGNAVELAARFGVTRNMIQKIGQGAIRARGTVIYTAEPVR